MGEGSGLYGIVSGEQPRQSMSCIEDGWRRRGVRFIPKRRRGGSLKAVELIRLLSSSQWDELRSDPANRRQDAVILGKRAGGAFSSRSATLTTGNAGMIRHAQASVRLVVVLTTSHVADQVATKSADVSCPTEPECEEHNDVFVRYFQPKSEPDHIVLLRSP